MKSNASILAFSGSARRESLNRKLLAVAVQAVTDAGGMVTLIDLNDFELPLYHGDLEDDRGLPENAAKLAQDKSEKQVARPRQDVRSYVGKAACGVLTAETRRSISFTGSCLDAPTSRPSRASPFA